MIDLVFLRHNWLLEVLLMIKDAEYDSEKSSIRVALLQVVVAFGKRNQKALPPTVKKEGSRVSLNRMLPLQG